MDVHCYGGYLESLTIKGNNTIVFLNESGERINIKTYMCTFMKLTDIKKKKQKISLVLNEYLHETPSDYGNAIAKA